MKSHAFSSINGAALGEGISDSQGSEARAQYLREAELKHGLLSMLTALGFPVTRDASRSRSCASWKLSANRVSDDFFEWDPLILLPSDPSTGWQPAVFLVASSQCDAYLSLLGGTPPTNPRPIDGEQAALRKPSKREIGREAAEIVRTEFRQRIVENLQTRQNLEAMAKEIENSDRGKDKKHNEDQDKKKEQRKG